MTDTPPVDSPVDEVRAAYQRGRLDGVLHALDVLQLTARAGDVRAWQKAGWLKATNLLRALARDEHRAGGPR